MLCPTCKKSDMTEAREEYRYDESGIPNVTLSNIVIRRCPQCGEVMPLIRKMMQLHRLIQLPGDGPVRVRFSVEEDCWVRRVGFLGCDIRATSGATDEIDQYAEVAAEFMLKIFGLNTRQYSLSDDSTLADLVCDSEAATVKASIENAFGFNPEPDRLIDIFQKIESDRLAAAS